MGCERVDFAKAREAPVSLRIRFTGLGETSGGSLGAGCFSLLGVLVLLGRSLRLDCELRATWWAFPRVISEFGGPRETSRPLPLCREVGLREPEPEPGERASLEADECCGAKYEGDADDELEAEFELERAPGVTCGDEGLRARRLAGLGMAEMGMA